MNACAHNLGLSTHSLFDLMANGSGLAVSRPTSSTTTTTTAAACRVVDVVFVVACFLRFEICFYKIKN